LDTDHSFYLLDGQIVNNGRAPLLERRSVGEERRDGHFGRHSDVAQWRRRMRCRPLGDVKQPFGAVAVFKQVANLCPKSGGRREGERRRKKNTAIKNNPQLRSFLRTSQTATN